MSASARTSGSTVSSDAHIRHRRRARLSARCAAIAHAAFMLGAFLRGAAVWAQDTAWQAPARADASALRASRAPGPIASPQDARRDRAIDSPIGFVTGRAYLAATVMPDFGPWVEMEAAIGDRSQPRHARWGAYGATGYGNSEVPGIRVAQVIANLTLINYHQYFESMPRLDPFIGAGTLLTLTKSSLIGVGSNGATVDESLYRVSVEVAGGVRLFVTPSIALVARGGWKQRRFAIGGVYSY